MTVDVLVRNNVKVLGSGSQTIVFVHGFGCDQDMWRYIVPGFMENYQRKIRDSPCSKEWTTPCMPPKPEDETG